MKKFKKKGQVESVGIIITLIVGVGVAVLILIFVGSLGGSVYTMTESDISNIGLTPASSTFIAELSKNVSLGNTNISSGTLIIQNGTTTLSATNYSVDYAAGNVELLESAYNNTNLSATYSYYANSIRLNVQDSIVSSFKALETSGNYMPIIVLAVIIAIVMAMVLGMMTIVGKGKGGIGGAL